MSNNRYSLWDDDEELTDLSDEDDELDPTPPPPPPPPPVTLPTPSIDFLSCNQTRSKSTRPSTQRATLQSRERGGLKTFVPPTLPQPRNVTLPISCINDFIDQKLIDLNAEYQRGVVWNDTKQMGLIDSLFRNFHVPSIIFACTQREDGSQLRVCIDGKQRLTSIYRFVKGEIAYKDPTTGKKSYYCAPPGSRRKLIPLSIKQTFGNKQIACVEYDNIDGELEREIFQRVQLGVTLGPADRLPAINGPYADLVRHLRREIDTTDGLKGYLDWGETRGKDFQALAQVVYLIAHGFDAKKAEPTTSRLEAFLNQPGDGSSLSVLIEKAISTMQIFCRIIRHPDLNTPFTQDLAPIEFVMSAYLIFLYRETFSDKQLSLSIAGMRQHLLQAFPSRKFKTDAFKLLLAFITKQVPKLKVKLQSNQDDIPAIAVPATIKRKRDVDHDADETDIVPVKKPKSAQKQKVESKGPASAAEPKGPASTSRAVVVQARAGKARTTIKKSPVKKTSSTASGSNSSIVSKKTASDYKTDIDLQTAKPSIKPKRLSQASSRESTVGVCQNTVSVHSVPGRLPRLPSFGTSKSTTEAASSELVTPESNSTVKPQQQKGATADGTQHVHSALASSSNRPPVSSGSTSLNNLKFHKKNVVSADNPNFRPAPTSSTTSPIPTDPEWLAKLEALTNSYNTNNNSPMMTTQMFNPNFAMPGQRCLIPDPKTQRVPHPSAGVHSSLGSTSGTVAPGHRPSASVTRDPRTRPTSVAQPQNQTAKLPFPPT